MTTIKQSLVKIGKNPPFAIPGDFQTCPKSLTDIIRILNLPQPNFNELKERCVFDFTEENPQGIVFAHDDIWFLSNVSNIRCCLIEGTDLYRPTKVELVLKRSRNELIEIAGLNKDNYDHIGDLGYLDGLIFAPIQGKDTCVLLGIDEKLNLVAYALLPEDLSDAFVVINPWNKLLYGYKEKSKADRLFAYDISQFYQILPNRDQYGTRVHIVPREDKNILLIKEDGRRDFLEGVQGISFSLDGWMFVTWWYCRDTLFKECINYANHLRVYNSLSGMRLNEKEYNFEGHYDEIEGISVHPSGVIYIAVADNDVSSDDEFMIYALQQLLENIISRMCGFKVEATR